MQDWSGDATPIIEILLKISKILETNVVFESAELALENAQTSACELVDVSHQLSLVAKNDVYIILKQPRFVISSLLDVNRLLNIGIDEKNVPKKRVFFAIKKVEFYLSYVNEYGIHDLKMY